MSSKPTDVGRGLGVASKSVTHLSAGGSLDVIDSINGITPKAPAVGATTSGISSGTSGLANVAAFRAANQVQAPQVEGPVWLPPTQVTSPAYNGLNPTQADSTKPIPTDMSTPIGSSVATTAPGMAPPPPIRGMGQPMPVASISGSTKVKSGSGLINSALVQYNSRGVAA